MKLAVDVSVPNSYDSTRIQELVRKIQDVANGLAEGRITYRYNATSSAPVGGTWAAGDFVPNSSPSELGAGGSKYVITGWIRSSAGTWLACRSLTGN